MTKTANEQMQPMDEARRDETLATWYAHTMQDARSYRDYGYPGASFLFFERAQAFELFRDAFKALSARVARFDQLLANVSGKDLSHAEVAGMVRMLMRTDLNHETVCVIARDRIVMLAEAVGAADERLNAVQDDLTTRTTERDELRQDLAASKEELRIMREDFEAFKRLHETPDAVCSTVNAVRLDLARRAEFGLRKYGVTVGANPAEQRAWLQHAYEEALDGAVYLRRALDANKEETPGG